jgi:Ca-activated chloride channel family protein
MRTTLLAAGAALTLLTGTAAAQGWIERDGPAVGPRPPSSVVRVGSAVQITLDGRIARYEVVEHFRNTGGGLAEGSYLYPIPGDAAFTDFSLFIGDAEVKGEMMTTEQARGIYETIVRRQRDPALLTLAGHGLIRAQVFPIQPGETRKITLRFTQVVARDGSALRLRYPLGARGDGPVTVTATAAGATRLGTPYSPTHQLDWSVSGDRMTMRVTAEARGDLEILVPLRDGLVGTSLLTHAPGGGERHFMLVVSPPVISDSRILPKDLTMVVDVSGSMSGTKLDQARTALLQALASLRPSDRFRLIAFSSGVREFAAGFQPASPEVIRRARAFVEGLQANGGTNIEGAIATALGQIPTQDRLGIVLFLTDGLPSVGEQAPERLAAAAAARRGATRIFPVGVGHDVNTYLLDRMATEGRGRVEYVAPEASVETALGNLLSQIDAPVLTDLRVVRSPVRFEELAPSELPDLFLGEELILTGRYVGAGTGDLVIEGRQNGRPVRITTQADFPSHGMANDFIPPIWAARRVGALTRQARLEGQSGSLVEEIRRLGLRYGIITEYTSYLVQEPGQVVATNQPGPAFVGGVAPARQVGQESFRRAERSAQLVEVKTLSAAGSARDEAEVAGRLPTRRAGGRLFVQRGGVWTDAGHTDTLQVVSVTAFSPAYFALLRALPELADCLAGDDEVLVGGRSLSIRLGQSGLTAWTTGELERTVRGFRGA